MVTLRLTEDQPALALNDLALAGNYLDWYSR